MYKFEKRLEECFMAFENLVKEKDSVNRSKFISNLHNTIILARTVTFIIQGELNKKLGFNDWYAFKQKQMKGKGFPKPGKALAIIKLILGK